MAVANTRILLHRFQRFYRVFGGPWTAEACFHSNRLR